MKRLTHAFVHAARIVGVGLCLATLTGCGTDVVKQQQVQSNLVEAQRQAQLGHTQEARRWVDRAIAIAPNTAGTYVAPPTFGERWGIADLGGDQGVFTSVGDDASVVFYLTKAAQQFPNDTRILQALSSAQGRMGDMAGQRTSAAKLAVLIESQLGKPGHVISAELINTLGQAYWDAGDSVKGTANFRRVIATYPHTLGAAQAENSLAYNYAVTDDKAHLAEAHGLAQSALDMVPRLTLPDAAKDDTLGAFQDTLGWVQYRQGDYQNAFINLQKGANAIPRQPESRYHLAMAYKALSKLDDARTELSIAVHIVPDYADAKRELAALPPTD